MPLVTIDSWDNPSSVTVMPSAVWGAKSVPVITTISHRRIRRRGSIQVVDRLTARQDHDSPDQEQPYR